MQAWHSFRPLPTPTLAIRIHFQQGEVNLNIEIDGHRFDAVFEENKSPTLKDKNGNIIGAIGVSGSSVEDDHEVALAGSAVLKK